MAVLSVHASAVRAVIDNVAQKNSYYCKLELFRRLFRTSWVILGPFFKRGIGDAQSFTHDTYSTSEVLLVLEQKHAGLELALER